MSDEFREKLISYRTTMAMVKKLLSEGIISAKEYDEIDTIMTKKYGLNSCTIFR